MTHLHIQSVCVYSKVNSKHDRTQEMLPKITKERACCKCPLEVQTQIVWTPTHSKPATYRVPRWTQSSMVFTFDARVGLEDGPIKKTMWLLFIPAGFVAEQQRRKTPTACCSQSC